MRKVKAVKYDVCMGSICNWTPCVLRAANNSHVFLPRKIFRFVWDLNPGESQCPEIIRPLPVYVMKKNVMEIEWTIALKPITTEGRYNSVVLVFKNHECNLDPPFSHIPVTALQWME